MKTIQLPIISNPEEYCWGDWLVYTWIKYKANTQNFSSYVKITDLMNYTNFSADKINSAIFRLQEKGWIKIYSKNNFVWYYVCPVNSKNYIDAEILLNSVILPEKKEFLLRLNPYIKQVNERNAYCWLTKEEILAITGLTEKNYIRYTRWLKHYNFIKWYNGKWWFNIKRLQDKYV